MHDASVFKAHTPSHLEGNYSPFTVFLGSLLDNESHFYTQFYRCHLYRFTYINLLGDNDRRHCKGNRAYIKLAYLSLDGLTCFAKTFYNCGDKAETNGIHYRRHIQSLNNQRKQKRCCLSIKNGWTWLKS